MCLRVISLLLLSILHPTPSYTEEATPPTVLLAILARSRAHILPMWLGLIENLNYPKSSIAVYIQTGLYIKLLRICFKSMFDEY